MNNKIHDTVPPINSILTGTEPEKQSFASTVLSKGGKRIYRLPVLLVPLLIFIFSGAETREAMIGSLTDAYTQVSVFVAFTLLLYYILEKIFKLNTAEILKKHARLQVPISAFLGALPGCGGAIIVITQYVTGRLGFGSLVAVLCSTMGDAAFLLLAAQPLTALKMLVISLVAGIIFGYAVEWLHGYDFLRQKDKGTVAVGDRIHHFGLTKWPWIALLVPGFILGLMLAFQADPDEVFGLQNLTVFIGVTGALACVLFWFINPHSGTSSYHAVEPKPGVIWDKVIMDTSFVTIWVIMAYLIFELTVLWGGFDLKDLFASHSLFLPLIAILIGFIPGCGPQVLVTAMFVAGYIPFSAQLGNGISNDGDALFPAIALSPKVSIVATIYTAIPALILSYGYMFLFE